MDYSYEHPDWVEMYPGMISVCTTSALAITPFQRIDLRMEVCPSRRLWEGKVDAQHLRLSGRFGRSGLDPEPKQNTL